MMSAASLKSGSSTVNGLCKIRQRGEEIPELRGFTIKNVFEE
jgi:hypothetical protein